MKWSMDLTLFDTTYTVTVYKDSGITTATPSADSGAKNTEITLTVTPASGYEVAEYEVIAGGVTVNPSTKKFKIGEANVIIYVKSKADNKYLVTEECKVCINGGAWTILHKNAVVNLTPNGVPKSVTAENGGASVTVNDAVQYLIDQGILVKI